MSDRVIAVVQARMGSSRLPNKSMMPLAGRPMVHHVLERAAAISGVAEVVLATSLNDRDTPLANLARDLGFRFWRGSEHDVLGRFAAIARATQADTIIRITGDCPFLAPEVCHKVLSTAREEPWWDYVSNDVDRSGYPDGTDCEVFGRLSLERADAESFDHNDREHVTPWMRRNLSQRTVHSTGEFLGHVKLSVDCEENLQCARTLALYIPIGDFSLPTTMRAYRQAFPETPVWYPYDAGRSV